MVSALSFINRLLPFAVPGTPLLQDLAHLFAICAALYIASTIVDSRRHQAPQLETDNTDNAHDDSAGIYNNDAHAHAGEETDLANAQIPQERQEDAEPGDEGPWVNGEDVHGEPAAAGRGTPSSAQRNIGAKKAKSLARKDQRKAYNEFMRSQGDAQRARDSEGAAEREAALEAERKRRALAEAELLAKKAKEREQKREAEEAERTAEYRRRETAIALVKADLLASNISDLHRIAIQVGGDVDVEWVERVVNASGLVGNKGEVLTMITSTGWAASITRAHATSLYDQAVSADLVDQPARVSISAMSNLFVDILQHSPRSD